jgi:broad specificity phosphatase PhoE
MSSKQKPKVSPEKRTLESVDADSKELALEEPSQMDKLLAMLAQSSLDTQQSNLESKQLREELREQREQSKYDIDRLYRSTSNLEERMNGVLEDLKKEKTNKPVRLLRTHLLTGRLI